MRRRDPVCAPGTLFRIPRPSFVLTPAYLRRASLSRAHGLAWVLSQTGSSTRARVQRDVSVLPVAGCSSANAPRIGFSLSEVGRTSPAVLIDPRRRVDQGALSPPTHPAVAFALPLTPLMSPARATVRQVAARSFGPMLAAVASPSRRPRTSCSRHWRCTSRSPRSFWSCSSRGRPREPTAASSPSS